MLPDDLSGAQAREAKVDPLPPALEVLNTSVVVTADSHNPSILHPSFLVAEGIVPSKWALAEPPICTPAISVVKFRNGVVFSVESGKFQVLQNAPVDTRSDVVPTLAARYVEKLPYVRYTAVGINLTGVYEMRVAERLLIDRFIRSGPWSDDKLHLKSVGIRFVFDALGAVFRLSFDPGKITNLEKPEEKTGVVVAGNYNFDVDPSAPMKTALAGIAHYTDCVAHFATAANTVFESSL
jgi:hypothetical protein